MDKQWKSRQEPSSFFRTWDGSIDVCLAEIEVLNVVDGFEV